MAEKLRRELKLNNKERSFLEGSAGYSRFVYNYGLNLVKESWGFDGIQAGDSKRLAEVFV
jgi:putative transposase